MQFIKRLLKNRWTWIALLFLFGAAGSQAPRLEMRTLRVTINLHRIERGMTLVEIEEILGPPVKLIPRGPSKGTWYVWEDGRTEAWLGFDPTDERFTHLLQWQKKEEGLVQKMKVHLGRLIP
jgi:hypothetical protein